MDDLGVIDSFMDTFVRYIDSGFGLLDSDVGFLTATLIGIDVTLAALFWTLDGADDVLARLVKKIIYVGAFAFIIGNFAMLANIIFESFAAIGLKAGGGAIGVDDLLKPGRLAGTGFEAAWPLLEQASDLVGPIDFFDNFVQIAVLMIAWVIVIVAFFVLAVQLFITILEFKLTSLAGFILVPFALWNRTSFLAERVLGSVVTSGIKVMVLAVIVGIGSNYFADFTSALTGDEVSIAQAVSLMLASLAMLGLSIFGPGIASGLVAGAPQLGAGSVAGTALAAAGMAMVAKGAASRAAGGGLSALRAGTSLGAGASAAYQLGRETSAGGGVAGGLAGVGRAASGAMRAKAGEALGLGAAAERGRSAAFAGLNDRAPSGGSSAEGAPAWARSMSGDARSRHHAQAVIHAVRDGDRGGSGAVPDIKEKDEK
ncbi:P-type conjugative transfer protein TrbL [Sphingomonas colocasiae]|uniref:P-type conjugative transfer protein TrbL n=1 Tax=Sphingomonas colocasiae TaxID=1848973 RepID=A0ABS7PIF4_9SPHN|nr:P-type conjugative transfer protein TrbL [Sphingomonas colocasiae]MBY8821081.1 P-type conjugative transfer protein TrbL [Sphingomonas colocasiae]